MIGKFLRWRNALGQSSFETSKPPSAPPEPERYDIALRDMSESGWFNQERGELYPHFPVARDDVVLDVGCGHGGKTAFCARQGAHVVFADVDKDKVESTFRMLAPAGARALTPIVSDSNPLPLPDGIASKIIASDVLEHVEDPAAFLNELARVGRPGSVYLLTVPDPVAEGLQKQLAPSVYFEKPNHIRIIEREAFARMVTDAGLEIVHRGADGFYSALWWQFFWTSGVSDVGNPRHPLLDAWSDTWRALLATPDGMKVKAALDAFMPMTQCIVARKPG